MAIIIETCPKCGHDLMSEVICTYPPIPKKSCPSCGWYWEGEPEQVIRQPFGGNSFYPDDNHALVGSVYNELVNVDDTCCMANNLNGYVFMVDENKLKDDVSKYNDHLAEELKKYINKKFEIAF
jgi:uncharacterized Zn finger protein